jgi:hypothetical protein
MVYIAEAEVVKLEYHTIAIRRYNISRLASECSHHRIVKVKVIQLLEYHAFTGRRLRLSFVFPCLQTE